MQKVLENKFFIGVIVVYILLIAIGGLMTKGMNESTIVQIDTHINM